MKKLFTVACIVLTICVKAQVKIGDNPATINANSLLELESTNKGFLPPRVALNNINSSTPLTAAVAKGTLVFSSGGTLADGYYYWEGAKWRLVATSELNAVAKTANATLLKTETFVLASGDITLTLPTITTSDNGLAITVKNIGTYTDQVEVKGNSTAKIDGKDNSTLTRWFAKTYVAYNGNWVKKDKEEGSENLLDVSSSGSWTTIEEALAFLDKHMSGPSVIRLNGGTFSIESTQTIDLTYPLTIQGMSYGKATIEAGTGLGGNPMFKCLSECYFKMIAFEATATYGNASDEDAIQLFTPEEYYEIKDCSFEGFNKAIVAKSNVEMWIFEVDINNAKSAGIELAAGATTGVSLKISEVDFTGCAKGVNMLSGAGAVVSILNSTFYNSAGGIGINYVPATFTAFSSMFITNNSWNDVGTFFSGFDFTRTDGRDAGAFIQNNAGDGDKNPTCRINVNNNSLTTPVSSAGTWVKANWVNTSFTTTKWTVNNNKIIFQPSNKRDGYAIITGNIAVNNNNTNISIAIVKNGNTAVRIGESDLRLITANQPFQFSTVIYLTDIQKNDYFELYCTSNNSGDVVTFRDVQWFTDTK